MESLGAKVSVLCVGVLLVSSLAQHATPAAQSCGCSQPDDRCLPIQLCSLYYQRVKAGEHRTNASFVAHLRKLLCEPPSRAHRQSYICCPKANIRCTWNDRPGVCTLQNRCSLLDNKTEADLLRSNQTGLCYEHQNEKYFCCVEKMCVNHPGLCVDATPGWIRSVSAFQRCEDEGSFVPRALCPFDGQNSHGSAAVCCRQPEASRLMKHPTAAVLARMRCGIPGDVNKFQGGRDTEPGEFPWMVVLRYEAHSNALCSGTLIHPRYVLTAARCIDTNRNQPDRVRLGWHDLLKTPKLCRGRPAAKCSFRVREHSVEKAIVHTEHDVGLLQLAHPVELYPGVREPICLPIYDSLRMHLPNKLIVTGWGMLWNDLNPSSLLLRGQQTVVLTDNQQGCEIKHSFCTRDDDEDDGLGTHCPGNTGGPYQAPDMYNKSMRLVQYGIISGEMQGRSACGDTNRGTLVGYVIRWILDNMNIS